jgi:hypothetical protein
MVVGNLNIFRVNPGPYEANSKLVVDPDRMLSFAISPQLLKMVARRVPEIIERRGRIQHDQLAPSRAYEVRRKTLARPLPVADRLGFRILVALDHRRIAFDELWYHHVIRPSME